MRKEGASHLLLSILVKRMCGDLCGGKITVDNIEANDRRLDEAVEAKLVDGAGFSLGGVKDAGGGRIGD